MTKASSNPLARYLPPVKTAPGKTPRNPAQPPSVDQIRLLWDKYEVASHIREHSAMVAKLAHHLAFLAIDAGLGVNADRTLAAGLLHDIAKTYCVLHGGNHSQTGAAWALEATGDLVIASTVYHHVYWPFPLDLATHFIPLAVLYADKRVAHTSVVTLNERYEDLLDRYGVNEIARERIGETQRQALELETILSDTLGEDLNACSFDRGRLVQ